MIESLKLSQTICAKICHDLAGSIGAIDNCLSLLDGSNESIAAQAKTLAHTESKNLIEQIKFLRNIYGLSDNEKETSIENVLKSIKEFLEVKSVAFNVHVTNEEILINSQITKVIFCLISIISENIGKDGSIDFYIYENCDLIKIIAKNQSQDLKEETFAILNGDNSPELSVRNCRAHYIYKLCATNGYKTSVEKHNNLYEYLILKQDYTGLK